MERKSTLTHCTRALILLLLYSCLSLCCMRVYLSVEKFFFEVAVKGTNTFLDLLAISSTKLFIQLKFNWMEMYDYTMQIVTMIINNRGLCFSYEFVLQVFLLLQFKCLSRLKIGKNFVLYFMLKSSVLSFFMLLLWLLRYLGGKTNNNGL